jgi:hypothetical protein
VRGVSSEHTPTRVSGLFARAILVRADTGGYREGALALAASFPVVGELAPPRVTRNLPPSRCRCSTVMMCLRRPGWVLRPVRCISPLR